MKRIIYFTEHRTATDKEREEIAAIREDIAPKFELLVFSREDNPNYGAGPLPADYVAGYPPEMEAYGNVEFYEISEE